ncbi:RING-type domain-containing protein [Citrus sinensis]|nr:RING-type domain-containing protein [Citrus sinensis]
MGEFFLHVCVILPSLQRLHSNLRELDDAKIENLEIGSFDRMRGDSQVGSADLEREDECGICLEPCTKMVLPNCCHAMCIKCYRNWNTKSESCPFCRGSMKRVNSEDLWVLTCTDDVIDPETVSKEDLLRFYLYINSLPKDYPDALFVVYYEYLI